jgi:uncharacterized protein (DUF4213/DUF364 family)
VSRSLQGIYATILGQLPDDVPVEQLCLGLTWTWCRTALGIGFAQSPGAASRVLDFPGSVAGRRASEVAAWLQSWNPFEATVGLAAANAVVNQSGNELMAQATLIDCAAPANLAVFEHFRPRLEHRKVVVVGRYPGLDSVLEGLDVTVLERQPGERDLPDPAAEYLLPQADWVFLTATSLINKTFPRLAELASGAVTVLMGPSTPWLADFADYGIDYLAGVVPVRQRARGRHRRRGWRHPFVRRRGALRGGRHRSAGPGGAEAGHCRNRRTACGAEAGDGRLVRRRQSQALSRPYRIGRGDGRVGRTGHALQASMGCAQCAASARVTANALSGYRIGLDDKPALDAQADHMTAAGGLVSRQKKRGSEDPRG